MARLLKRIRKNEFNKFNHLGNVFNPLHLINNNDKNTIPKIPTNILPIISISSTEPLIEGKIKKYKKKKVNEFEAHELSQQVDELISCELYDTVFMMMKNGYALNIEQSKTLSDILYPFIYKQDWLKIEEWISKGWTLTEKEAASLLLDEQFQKKFGGIVVNLSSDMTEFPFLISHLQYLSTQASFNQLYLSLWEERLQLISELSHDDEINSIIYPVKNYHHYLFKSIDHPSDFLTIYSNYAFALNHHRAFNEFIDIEEEKTFKNDEVEYMKNLSTTLFPAFTEELLQATRKIFTPAYIQKLITKNGIEHIHQTNIADMPINTTTILEEIETSSIYILYNFNILPIVQQQQIQKLIDITLPKLLEEYLSLPVSFKDNFFNGEGKNATDLIIENLTQLNAQLLEQCTYINGKKSDSSHTSMKKK